MSNPLKILQLEDSATDAEIVQRLLKKEKPHCEFSLAMNREAYVLALNEFKPDIILADNSLPQFSAAEALEITRRSLSHTPFIMVTNTESEESDTDIIKLGADDYVLKDRLMRLPVAIEVALKQQNAEKEKLAAIEKLNLNEENYRNMVERISDGFIALDLNWRFTYINKKAEQLFRRPQGSLIGKQIWSEFPETIDRPFYKAYHKAMETQENSTLKEYSILLESWVEANIYPSLSGISIYFRDITEQKKAEEEIRGANERFQTLSKATNDAVWDWDLITDEVWWSESFYNFLGFDSKLPAPDLYEWTKKIHPDDRDKVIEKLKKVRKDNANSWEDEFRFQLADGSYGTALDRAYVLRDDSGKPVRMIGALMDITQRKRLVKELEVLSIIAKETGNGVLIFDKKNEHVLWINEGFTRLTGYTQQDMFSKIPVSILYGTETNQDTVDYINIQKAGNLPYSADILIYTKEGRKKWHYISGQPMPDENGKITKYFVLSTDISDRLRLEQERLSDNIRQQKEVSRAILHAQETERNELGRELHDNINQILSAISMKLDFCIENYPTSKAIAEDCRQNVQDAIKETRNLSHRMVMPRFSEMSLKNILKSLVANYSAKQIVQLDTDQMIEKDIPSAVKETLFRIVQEQLSNIQKHAKADKIRIRLGNDPGHVAMLIEDNGIGFDTHQKRKGIGITNILNRVESYNGTVDIISQPGKGCTLSVNIPLTGLNDHTVANGF
jgi:PAS domain S-box-containing protein